MAANKKKEEDNAQLQRDISILYSWSLENKMKFYPDKCKVLTIKHKTFSVNNAFLCCLSISSRIKLAFICR